MTNSAYIHIPFCKSKCKYCSFISFTNENRISEYICTLIQEIKHFYKGESLNTLYFGGGTPSYIAASHIKEIYECFNLNKNCEITIEINPDDVSIDYLKQIYDIGINRISIGSQTFNDDILKAIDRRHDSKQIIDAVHHSQRVGFKNISLDLIYGLPNQNIKDLKNDLKIITELNIQHISTYGLKIENNSYFGNNKPNNLPNDDTQADMYEFINEYLDNNNFNRYEISNFAKAGYESKHNLNYWNNKDYYGFGISAHGYVNSCRYSNSITMNEYLKKPILRAYEHIVTTKEQLEETIFLGFRKSNGINIKEINKKFNIDFDKKYKNVLSKYVPNYIQKTPEGYTLTLQGVLLSNIILSDFI